MRLAALVALVLLSIGARCGGGGGGGTPPASVTAFFEPASITAAAGTPVSVDLVVRTGGGALQAWEMTIAVDPAVLSPVRADPHPEFDDDGQLFVAPIVDAPAGEIRRVVDLRHGAGASGEVRIATLEFQAGQPGQTSLTIKSGGAALASGAEFPIITVAGTVTVTP